MTPTQVALIKAREDRRANAERERLEKRSQDLGAVTNLANLAFRGLGSTLLGKLLPDKSSKRTGSTTIHNDNRRYYSNNNRNRERKEDDKQ